MTLLPQSLVDQLIEFRRAREWEQFHSARNLAAAISVEAAELLQCFTWATDAEVATLAKENRDGICQEIADIAILLTYLAHDLAIDLEAAVKKKIEINAEKYPVEKARGSNRKYTKL
jgi:NTP pyrophosphatase (non-canonical NTP hydrolase)